MSVLKKLSNFLAFLVGLFIGLFAAVWGWLTLFVTLLGYDYVIASSMLFILFSTIIGLNSIGAVFVQEGRARAFAALFGFVIYPLALSAVLKFYESWMEPAMSDAINVVAGYRDIMSMPAEMVQTAIADLGPAFASAVATIEASPLLTAITVLSLQAAIAQFTGGFGFVRARN